MRNIFAAFFVAFFIPVIVAQTIAAADVANGVRAYDAGWYDEALAEFLPAAEAGNVPQLKRYSALEKKARRAPRGMWRRE